MKRRKRKLINTRFQLRMTLWFIGVTTLVMVLQFLLLARTMSSIGLDLPNDSQLFFTGVTGALLQTFLASLGLALALVTVTSILATHRVAGPVYRFTQFLEAVMRGEHPGECRIRKNDELQDLCEVLNRATAKMRAESVHESSTEGEARGESSRAA